LDRSPQFASVPIIDFPQLRFALGDTIEMLRGTVREYEIGAGTQQIRRWLIGRELFGETK
jgi:hypothetical protein